MKLILFATHEEATATLHRLNASSDLTFDGGMVLITGIGPFAAYTKTLPHIQKATSLYNLGIAGALHNGVQPDTLHIIGSTSKLEWHPKKPNLTLPIQLQPSGLRLCTLDFPLHDSPFKKELHQFDLVDMEGYALALLAQTHQKPITIIKIVSDTCNGSTSSDIQKNIQLLSIRLSSFAIN